MNLEEFKSTKYTDNSHFLLIGNPVSHSLSPIMHNAAAQFYDMPVQYFAVELDTSGLGSFASYMNHEQLKGVNITIPYKKLMMDYVDEIDERCRDIGAINTIQKRDHLLIGHNTDVFGFLQPLEKYQEEIEDGRAIIFGTGGAAKAIVCALNQKGVEENILVSRKPDSRNQNSWPANIRVCSYDSWPSFAEETTLFINATPLGMEPNIQSSPVEESEKDYLQDKICYDIVYRPQHSTFLKRAEEVGARTIGGLEMLVHQGSRSFELWTGESFPIEHIKKTLQNYLANAD